MTDGVDQTSRSAAQAAIADLRAADRVMRRRLRAGEGGQEDARPARREPRRRMQPVEPASEGSSDALAAADALVTSPAARDLPARRIAPTRPSIELAEFRELPPAPQRLRQRSYGALISFLLCVVVPTVLAALFYYRYSSDQYVAEFRFAVTDSSTTTSASSLSGLTTLLGGATAANPGQNYMVSDYLTSRQAVEELQAKLNVKQIYAKPTIDWWNRFDASLPMENFVKYWQRFASSSYDQVTGLATAQVRAFTAEDAYNVSTALVAQAEQLINDIARRPLIDSVKGAEVEVRRAEERLKLIRARLAEYRAAESIIDPVTGAIASNTALVQELRTALQAVQTELSVMKRQSLGSSSPTVRSLERREVATREQLAQVEGLIAKGREGSKSLSKVVGDFEQLDLERQFAQTMVTSTQAALEQARANALAQRIYVTPYVRPTMPESSTYPNRPASVATAAIVLCLVWLCGLLVVRSIGERYA